LKAWVIFIRPLARTITPSLTVGLLPRSDHPPATAGGTDLALNADKDVRAPNTTHPLTQVVLTSVTWRSSLGILDLVWWAGIEAR